MRILKGLINSKKISKDILFSYGVVILIAALTYLPLVTQLGFDHDDWLPMAAKAGRQDIKFFFTVDRLLTGITLAKGYALLGPNPLLWHLVVFIVRVSGGVAFLWITRMLWEKRYIATTSMGILFIIYPGFLLQPSALTFTPILMGLSLGIISISLAVRAVCNQNISVATIGLLVVSAVLVYPYIALYEMHIGLEFVRVIAIWYVLQRRHKTLRSFLHTGLYLIPYLVPTLGFFYWRLFVFESKRANVSSEPLIQGYVEDPMGNIVRSLSELFSSFKQTTLFAYFTPLKTGLSNVDPGDSALSLSLALVCMGLFWYYIRSIPRIQNNNKTADSNSRWSVHAIWIGMSIILLTLLVVTLTGRSVSFGLDFSRYTMEASIGVPILIVGVLYTIFKSRFRQVIIFLLICVSVVTQINNAAIFKTKWGYMRQLWWQMSWRAPQIERGTTLMVLLPEGYRIREGSTIFGAANLIYYPNPTSPLALYGEVIDDRTIEQVVNQEVILKYTRTLPITYDFGKTIVATIPDSESCLHIIDGNLIELPRTTDPRIYKIAQYSKIDLIDISEELKTPPKVVFGKEPLHNWCYYYQKANLARQRGDWDEIIRLGEEATVLGYGPQHTSEWMPFYVGYIQAGRETEAKNIYQLIMNDDPYLQDFCKQFEGHDLPGDSIELSLNQVFCE